MGRVFISYRRDDSRAEALLIRQRLTGRFRKRRVFMDVADIGAALDYEQVITDQLAGCDAVIAVIGDRWLTATNAAGTRRLDEPRDWVRLEIAAGLAQDIPVVPCLVRGARMPDAAQLPPDLVKLTTRQALALSDDDVDRDLTRLATAVSRAVWRNRWGRIGRRLRAAGTTVDEHRRALIVGGGTAIAAAGAGGYWMRRRASRPRLPEFAVAMLGKERPASITDFTLPTRGHYLESPQNWRDEVLYYVLPDRFSDGAEERRPRLPGPDLAAARAVARGPAWSWEKWARSGAERWQGGTLTGIRSKLSYLQKLGVSAVWLGPVFRQRVHADTYHGFAIQDFLDVDPRLGTRRDLVELVSAAHERNLRVILTVVFNHSGTNWLYPDGTPGGRMTPRYTEGLYPFGQWLDGRGEPVARIQGPDDGVWPRELQDPDMYVRAGYGNLGVGDFLDARAEHKRSDFVNLRKFRLDRALDVLAECYNYWLALTDCDGFHFDTLQHVTIDEARRFCDRIKQYATGLGKSRFFVGAEVVGSQFNQDRYLTELSQRLHANLDAIVDNGSIRLALTEVARGRNAAHAYFREFDSATPMGRHRSEEGRSVAVLDDLDNVFGPKTRFSAGARSDHQVAAALAFLLFSPGIPCIYYGTEQAFAGPEEGAAATLLNWRMQDSYLREAMFGPAHPRKAGTAGLPTAANNVDVDLPGFGPFGTAGHHCFDDTHPAYVRIAALIDVRRRYPALRSGGYVPRRVRTHAGDFRGPGAGEIVAWSRWLGTEEMLCLVNTDPLSARSADVAGNRSLAPGTALTVVLNSQEAAVRRPARYSGLQAVGSQLEVKASAADRYVEIRNLGPSEVLVLSSNPRHEDTEFGKVAENYRTMPGSGGPSRLYPGRTR